MDGLEKVPAALRERSNWVVWKTVDRNGPTKVPFTASGQPAQSNDPRTWTSFDEAKEAASNYDGVGYMFSVYDEFCGIDLDGCRNPDTGKVDSWAAEWLRRFDSYSEVSPSKTGVKIFVRGKNPRDGGKKKDLGGEGYNGKKPGVEMYDKLRYFAVTGMRLATSCNVEDRQSALNEFADTYWPRQSAQSVVSTPVIDRARKYMQRMDPAIAGQKGHDKTFSVACALVLGFGLSTDDAYGLLTEYNERCQPQWSEKELRHKVDSANQQAGERNYLRDAPQSQWPTIPIRTYKEPEKPKTEGVTIESAAVEYLVSLEEGKQNLVELGIADLDYSLGGGVALGEMVVVAARPSHGKSAVALQCLDHCAHHGLPGLLISEEMSVSAIGKRAIQYVTKTPEEHWRHDAQTIGKELQRHYTERSPVRIEVGCRTPDRATATIEHYANKGVKIVVVDYAQLLVGKGRGRYEQVTEMSMALRSAASKTGVVLIVLCQLNRAVETRNEFVPKMHDLKESGQIEQDADVIVFLVWPHRIDSKNDPKEFQIYVAKNRNRGIMQSAFRCTFNPSRQMFTQEAADAWSASNRNETLDQWNRGVEF